MLKEIKLTNLLSFGSETKITFNEGLNVLIGANGSGKSNLIEVISLLQAMPRDLTKVIRDGGGIEEWLWKGKKKPTARIEVIIEKDGKKLCHLIQSSDKSNYYVEEFITDYDHRQSSYNGSNFYCYNSYFNQEDSTPIIKQRMNNEEIYQEIDIDHDQSILAQRQDPITYPELTYLGKKYQQIRLYREWHFGRNTLARSPQRADLPNDFLKEDLSNLGLILSSFRRNSEIKRKLLESLRLFYDGIEDFEVIVQGGYVQVFFEENGFTIPATRLSDGTLGYLCLLAILLHPNPPPLICIEEPELGLHPDILPTLVDLLKEAAQKTQIIITTHSADLIDDLTDMPEAVLVFNKEEGSTTVERLNKEDLTEWLQKYSLGQLWSRGDIGGNRW
jgi:predicted ATPase